MKDKIRIAIAASTLVLFGAVVCFAWLPGRMTGGGSFFQGDLRVTHGFELHCGSETNPAPPPPNNLEVNWGGGNHFHLQDVTSAECLLDPRIGPPNPPKAPFNTYIGSGTGDFNNVSGATATWVFTDAGEPGTSDTAFIQIKDHNGTVVLTAGPSFLDNGNHQAHEENK